MMDPHHDRDFAARTNRDEVARLRDRVAELEAVLAEVAQAIPDDIDIYRSIKRAKDRRDISIARAVKADIDRAFGTLAQGQGE